MNLKYIPWITIAILLFVLWFKGCSQEPTTVPVTIPEISGEFEPQEPIYIKGKDSVITRWETREIKTQNPVNDSLALAYQEVKDSLERYKMYLTAIQIRDFSNTYEDEFVKFHLTGQVQGELNWIKPNYTIKERKIDVPVPQMKFRLLAGAEIGNNLLLNDFRWKANLGLQNAKGNIFRLGYGKEALQDYFYLGYDVSIFSISN
jgi:hypothetical protein